MRLGLGFERRRGLVEIGLVVQLAVRCLELLARPGLVLELLAVVLAVLGHLVRVRLRA